MPIDTSALYGRFDSLAAFNAWRASYKATPSLATSDEKLSAAQIHKRCKDEAGWAKRRQALGAPAAPAAEETAPAAAAPIPAGAPPRAPTAVTPARTAVDCARHQSIVAASAEDDIDDEAEDELPAAAAASAPVAASPEQGPSSTASDEEDADQEDRDEEGDEAAYEDDSGDGDGESEEEDVILSLLKPIEQLGSTCDVWFNTWLVGWNRGADDELPPGFLKLAAEMERRGALRRRSTPACSPACVGAAAPFDDQRCGKCCQCDQCQGHLCGACAGCCRPETPSRFCYVPSRNHLCKVHELFDLARDATYGEWFHTSPEVGALVPHLHVPWRADDGDPQLAWVKNLYQLWKRGNMDEFIPPAFLSLAQIWETRRALSRTSSVRICNCTGEMCSRCGNKCSTCTAKHQNAHCALCCQRKDCAEHFLLRKFQEDSDQTQPAAWVAGRAKMEASADVVDGKRAREHEGKESDESETGPKENLAGEKQVESPEWKKTKRS